MDPKSRKFIGRPRLLDDDPDLRALYLYESRTLARRKSNAKRAGDGRRAEYRKEWLAKQVAKGVQQMEHGKTLGLTEDQLRTYKRLCHPKYINSMTERDRLAISRGELAFSKWKFDKYGDPRGKNIQRARHNRIEDAIARGLLTGVEIARVRHPSLKMFTADERIRMVKEWSEKDAREARKKREVAQVRGRNHHRAD